MPSLGELVVRLLADVAPFRQGLAAAEKRAHSFRSSITNTFKSLAATAGVTFSAAGILRYMNQLDELAKTARRAGVSAESLQELGFAAQLSGLSTEQLASGLQRAARTIGAAALGLTRDSSQIRGALEAVGLTLDELVGLKPDEMLLRIADAARRVGSEEIALQLALKIFGAEEFATLLQEGSDGLQRLGQEARTLGAVIDEETLAATERFNDSLTRLKVTMTPVLELLVRNLADLASTIEHLAQVAGAAQQGRQQPPGPSTLGRVAIGLQALGAAGGEFAVTGLGRLAGLTTESPREAAMRAAKAVLEERGVLPRVVEAQIPAHRVQGVTLTGAEISRDPLLRAAERAFNSLARDLPQALADAARQWQQHVVEPLQAEARLREQAIETASALALEEARTREAAFESMPLLRDPSALRDLFGGGAADTGVVLRGSREAVIREQQRQQQDMIALLEEQLFVLRELLDQFTQRAIALE
ncbi:MAG: hypothetical protein KatS3mg038_2012 [Candidatus Kapaibacterium sp.]|nr:MAG: hypothetical protein KatS3mg038_1392 [Candidatus Kapabacteria bacterium]GIV51491.1 MAG: hypothetical protein KatS3mg038_2012 [Candidatus Kapabacteria bacterium]